MAVVRSKTDGDDGGGASRGVTSVDGVGDDGDGASLGVCANIPLWCPTVNRSSVCGCDGYTYPSACEAARAHGGLEELRPGATSYVGSKRNGIDSHVWAAWGCSFVFLSRTCAPGSAGADQPAPSSASPESGSTDVKLAVTS